MPMYYAILCEDVPDSLPLRQQARPAHLERIQALVDQGRVLAAGPHPALDTPEPGDAGFTGSLVIAEFESLEDATAWADSASRKRAPERPGWACRICQRRALA